MPFEKDPNELGALWVKSGKKGEYMTGSITIDGRETRLVLFRNGNKRSEKAPDWKILKSVPRERDEAQDIPPMQDYGDPPF